MSSHNNKLVIVMGVSGTGKSTVAEKVAEKLDYHFVEADDFHTEESKKMMANKQSISAEAREIWVQKLLTHLTSLSDSTKNVVMTYSGLIAAQRQRFRLLPFDVSFVLLQGSVELITERINMRKGHFVDPEMLASQFALFEPLTANENDVLVLDVVHQPAELVQQVIKEII